MTKRTDGHVQVTYHGHPLYFYASEHVPGDTTGQALNQFGAEWRVLTPAGTKLERRLLAPTRDRRSGTVSMDGG